MTTEPSVSSLSRKKKPHYTIGQLSDTRSTKPCTFFKQNSKLTFKWHFISCSCTSQNISSHSSSPYPSHFSLSLSLSFSLSHTPPPLSSCLCAPCLFTLSITYRDASLIWAVVRAEKLPFSVTRSSIQQPVLLWRIQRRGEEEMKNLLQLPSYVIPSISLCGSICFCSQSFAAKGAFSSTEL